MHKPLQAPCNNNPLKRTRQPLLPPQPRSRTAHFLTLAAAEGRFALLRCQDCHNFVAPAHDCCPQCLSVEFDLADAPQTGIVLSLTEAEVPFLNYFRERAPWRVALVKLDCGPNILAHAHYDAREEGKVTVNLKLDKAGQAVFYAAPFGSEATYMQDPQWREMTADPLHRRVLITDGRNPVTPHLVKDLLKAGVRKIFVGLSDPWKPYEFAQSLPSDERILCVPLDLRSERSVFDFSRAYGAKLEIVLNTADHIRPGGFSEPAQSSHSIDMMDIVAMGSMRLASHLSPVFAARAADGEAGATAWVNLLSIYSQAPSAAFAGYSMAHAAALNFSHSLRADLRHSGIRVANVFMGPTDSEWFQTMPQPRVNGAMLSRAIIEGLKLGLEDIYVGAVAQDIQERLRKNPKAAEREISVSRPGG